MFKLYKQFSYGWKQMAQFNTLAEAEQWKVNNHYIREWSKIKIIEDRK